MTKILYITGGIFLRFPRVNFRNDGYTDIIEETYGYLYHNIILDRYIDVFIGEQEHKDNKDYEYAQFLKENRLSDYTHFIREELELVND